MEIVDYSGLPDWWDEIDENERAEIKEGLAQADRGEVIPHKEVCLNIRNGFRNN